MRSPGVSDLMPARHSTSIGIVTTAAVAANPYSFERRGDGRQRAVSERCAIRIPLEYVESVRPFSERAGQIREDNRHPWAGRSCEDLLNEVVDPVARKG